MKSSRAVRTANELLSTVGNRRPVPVEKLAKEHAVVVRQELPREISGLLLPLLQSDDLRWAIVVNSSDAAVRQRFTIAHELGHLLLHRFTSPHADGRHQIRFRNEESSTGTILEEIEANQFAASLLMPEDYLRKALSDLRIDITDAEQDSEAYKILTQHAAKLQVSVQALTFRIANLGLG